ncbi:MAG: nucleotidyltransferase domain-containing protein [Euryarchaeota archaeon]|nr:nucleotidyltransferase domain-containing protein [Euryarchaeota archaeon]
MMEPMEVVNKIKEIIAENYHPDKIVLFGSYARKDFDEQYLTGKMTCLGIDGG